MQEEYLVVRAHETRCLCSPRATFPITPAPDNNDMDIIGSASVSTTVEQLVEGAQKQLFLITPYFKPWDRIGRAIKAAHARGVMVVLLLRGGEDRAKQEANAREFTAIGVKIGFLSRLHAKIYMTESEAIVTSMNLYDDSALNSWEVAIRFRADVDEAAYKEVKARVGELGRRAGEETQVAALEQAQGDPVLAMAQKWRAENPTQVRAAPVAAPRAAASRPSSPSRASAKGHCIRCSTPVPFNADRPLCADCYKAWAKYENPDYKEAHCHSCGKEKATSMAKPLCKPCWDAQA